MLGQEIFVRLSAIFRSVLVRNTFGTSPKNGQLDLVPGRLFRQLSWCRMRLSSPPCLSFKILPSPPPPTWSQVRIICFFNFMLLFLVVADVTLCSAARCTAFMISFDEQTADDPILEVRTSKETGTWRTNEWKQTIIKHWPPVDPCEYSFINKVLFL